MTEYHDMLVLSFVRKMPNFCLELLDKQLALKYL